VVVQVAGEKKTFGAKGTGERKLVLFVVTDLVDVHPVLGTEPFCTRRVSVAFVAAYCVLAFQVLAKSGRVRKST